MDAKSVNASDDFGDFGNFDAPVNDMLSNHEAIEMSDSH